MHNEKIADLLNEFVAQLKLNCYSYTINLGDCLSVYAPTKQNNEEGKTLMQFHADCMEEAIDNKGSDGYVCFSILKSIDDFMVKKINEIEGKL